MSHNQRRSYRCRVAELRRDCQLLVDGVTIDGKLQDESVGGFAVLMPHTVQVALHQTIQLHTDCGWFHVRIVYIREILPPKGVDMDAEGANPWIRLGLCRLSEAIVAEKPKVSWWLPVASYLNLLKLHLPAGTFLVAGIILVFVVAVIPVSLMYMTKDAEPLHGGWLKPIRALAVSKKTGSSVQTPKSDPSKVETTSASASKTESGSDSSSQPNSLLHLPGAMPFVVPEVVSKLDLSEEQQEQVRQLVKLTTSEMQKLEQKADSLDREQLQRQREHLLNQIRRKVLGLLTDDQLNAWDKMTTQTK
jgi:hypothetical protein